MSLPLPASSVRLHSLARGPFPHLQSQGWCQASYSRFSGSLPLPPPPFNAPVLTLGPPKNIQDNLILRSVD